jgi:uncharacterized membrane protein YccC
MHDFAAIVRGREAEIRLAIRVTVAAAGAYAVARLVALPQGYWAVITAILIMQTSLGGSLKAAIDRLGGTLAGAVYGAVVSIFIPHSTFPSLTAAIAVATGPMAILAAINSSFKIAPVTALMVLLPTPGNAAPPLIYALDRILEIGVGNIIGIVVAMFVLPARAHALLIHAAARVVLLNAELMKALIEGLAAGEGRPGLPAIHARIRAALKQMETAADEASRERRSHLTDMPDPEPLVRTLYRVRHDLVMIGRAAAKPLPKPVATTLLPRLFVLRDATVDLLSGLADALEAAKPTPSSEELDIDLKAFATAVDEIVERKAAGEEMGRMVVLRFSFEQLAQDLRDLGRRADEMAGHSAGRPST